MFTGLVEDIGTVIALSNYNDNISLWLRSSFTGELKIDESVAHNGICLTVESIRNDTYKVTAIAETIHKTNISSWKEGDKVNLERAMKLNDRLGGHIVQGHVDTTATCIRIANQNGSYLYTFRFDSSFAPLIIEKGSICINGTSLTAFNVGRDKFSVAIIPYTYEHTTIRDIAPGHSVNIEFDILGKYILRSKELNN